MSEVQEHIQEFIHDDNKIVTCKWLSLTLSIPVNSAKLALFKFVDSARNSGNNDDINVTYFMSGFDTQVSGTKILKCIVVPESHLESVKQTLSHVTSCHIYSVQKAKLQDYTPLYQADYDICRENAQTLSKFSAISCPWAILRDVDTKVKTDTDTGKSSSKADDISKSTTTSNTSSISPSSSTTASSNDKKADSKKPEKADSKKPGIASLFAAAGKKEKKVEKPSESKDSGKSTAVPKGKDAEEKKGMQSFLTGKHTASKAVKGKEPSPKAQGDSNTKQNKPKTSDSKSNKAQKHKLAGSDKPQRKRRRIRDDLFDSSDDEQSNVVDDDDEEDDDVDVVQSAEEDQEDADTKVEDEVDEKMEEEIVEEKVDDKMTTKDKSKAADNKDRGTSGKKRKRTRKLVPKQHIDEDGFMVTEKVWESDSTDASDEEVKEESPKVAKPVSPAKKGSAPKPAAKKKPAAVSPSKNKQTSLMSFFKKK